MSPTPNGRGLGCRPSLPDPRDWQIAAILTPPATLPAALDLSLDTEPSHDQGAAGSCTAFALGRAYRRARRLLHKWPRPVVWPDSLHYGRLEDYRISELVTYFQSRSLEGSTGSDSGATIRDAMASLRQFGACAWHNDPYDAARVLDTPPGNALRNATHHEVTSYYALDGSVTGFKQVLAGMGQFPVVGALLYESFPQTGPDGRVATPEPGRERRLGGHALCFVGYDDGFANLDGTVGALRFRNSWSTSWGMAGDCFIPYSYFSLGITWDAWCITAGAP